LTDFVGNKYKRRSDKNNILIISILIKDFLFFSLILSKVVVGH